MNFLSPTNFKVILGNVPNTEYFCTGITVPAVSLSSDTPEFATPAGNVRLRPTKMNYESVSIKLIIDENLENYTELSKWMHDSWDGSNTSDDSVDLTLMIMNSKNNPVKSFIFTDVFPVELGELTFSSSESEVMYITSDVTFEYTQMILK